MGGRHAGRLARDIDSSCLFELEKQRLLQKVLVARVVSSLFSWGLISAPSVVETWCRESGDWRVSNPLEVKNS